MITPRRTRLVRVPDLHAFRHAIVELVQKGVGKTENDSRPLSGSFVIVPNASAARQLHRFIRHRLDGPPAGPVEILTRDELYDRLPASLANPPRRLTPYERDVIAQAAAREACRRARRRRGVCFSPAPRVGRRDAAFLRSAAASAAAGRPVRGAARGHAAPRRGIRSRRRADAAADASAGSDLSRLRAPGGRLGRLRRARLAGTADRRFVVVAGPRDRDHGRRLDCRSRRIVCRRFRSADAPARRGDDRSGRHPRRAGVRLSPADS